jgi:hypothetical protein
MIRCFLGGCTGRRSFGIESDLARWLSLSLWYIDLQTLDREIVLGALIAIFSYCVRRLL